MRSVAFLCFFVTIITSKKLDFSSFFVFGMGFAVPHSHIVVPMWNKPLPKITVQVI